MWRVVNKFYELLSSYRRELVLSFLLAILPSYFLIWTPYLIGQLIDRALMARDIDLLWKFGLLILLCRTAQFLSRAASSYCLTRFGLQILVDYRNSLTKKVLAYPFSFFDRTSTGMITTRLNQDISSLHEFFSTAMVPLIGNLCLVVGGALVMIFMDWRLALSALCVLPLFVWLTIVTDVRIRRRFGFMRQALSMLNGFAAESFAGSRDIQLFGAARENERRFEVLSRRLWSKNLSAVKEYAFYNPLVPFITGLMDISILGFGGWLAYRGEISVGHIVAFLSYASYFGWPIREFAEKLTACQQAASAVDRLIEFGSHGVEINQGKNLFRRGLIEFNNLSFRYADELPLVLKNISFSARPGEKIALMGETGSGKTTTCSLLLRFYEPTHGRVSIAGIPASEIEIGSLRKNISWISQDIVLFSESVRENIRFFNLDISDRDIWKVLELVQLSSWVSLLPGGLDFVLTERGEKLSVGQRQLLSMARALVGRPSILIFDEATSAIDVRTEAVVQSALERLWESDDFSGITTFIIAHRLTTIRRCDRLYVYRDGEIVESGTYQDIVASNGYGASLFKRYSAPISELREIQMS